MAAKAPPIELPPLYYLTYFRFLTGFVREKYVHILRNSETKFLDEFDHLRIEAQCLFVRLITRKGSFFPIERLKYDEVPDLNGTLRELVDKDFIQLLCADDADCMEELLHKLTKKEILTLLTGLNEEKVRKSWSKGRLCDALMNYTFEEIINILEKEVPVIRCGRHDETEMIFFLFFGNLDNSLSDFVIRDIGYVKLEEIKAEHMTPQFATRMEAEQKLFLCKAYATYRILREGLPPDELVAWFEEVATSVDQWSAPARPVLDRMAVKLGYLLERSKEPDLAKRVYAYTKAPPSRERLVRLYRSEGSEEAALSLALIMSREPGNAEEFYFAKDFIETGSTLSRIRRSMTSLLKRADEILIDESARGYVEGGALQYFIEKGFRGYHCENYLWRNLFGLVFWDELFDGNARALHHPLQRTPSDLYHSNFYHSRKTGLLEKLTILECGNTFENYARTFFNDKQGINNPFIGWHEDALTSILTCYRLVGRLPLRKVLLEMCRNVKENGRGFPDLFVFTDSQYEFIEIKSPTDQLSAQQLYWIEYFTEAGINARVLRVGFTDNQSGITSTSRRSAETDSIL